MRCFGPAMVVLLLGVAIVPASMAGQRKAARGPSAAPVANPLDRVAYAVDGAESSHGADQSMWRADPAGPQGPMQVSQAAATDVGGGDRFDPDQNRGIGRAYLAQLYRRYGDWPDAIAAYNWGIGNLEAWVKAGRPADGREAGVAAYLGRVLHDSGLCEKAASAAPPRKAGTDPGALRRSRRLGQPRQRCRICRRCRLIAVSRPARPGDAPRHGACGFAIGRIAIAARRRPNGPQEAPGAAPHSTSPRPTRRSTGWRSKAAAFPPMAGSAACDSSSRRSSLCLVKPIGATTATVGPSKNRTTFLPGCNLILSSQMSVAVVKNFDVYGRPVTGMA